MTEHPDRPGVPRVAVGTNIYISAAISSSRSSTTDLIDLLVQGRAIPLVSPKLRAEVTSVLERPTFRRWLTVQESHDYVDALVSVAEDVEDPDPESWAGACRDPADDFLVALAEAHHAALLVSGDGDLLALDRGGLVVRSPAEAVRMLTYEHPWGPAVLPADIEDMWRDANARGDTPLLLVATSLLALLADDVVLSEVTVALEALVEPGTAPAWRRDVPDIREAVRDRAIASFPRRIGADVAHIALPADPGVALRMTADQVVTDVLWLTLVRTDLQDLLPIDGWRAFAIGARPLQIEDLPPPWGHAED